MTARRPTAARANGGYTLGSLFSGIGGIDLAFTAAGFDVRFQVEIEPFCQKVLTKHAPAYWPNAKLHGDIRHVGLHNLESVDVLAGGFPCQDISVAGKQAGIAVGTRSGLWFEFARLIGELRPRVVLLENVANIAVQGGTIVVGQLAEMGYDALWLPLRASDVDAPHQRSRWFCVAVASGTGARMEEHRSGGCTWQSAGTFQPADLRQEYGAVGTEGIAAGGSSVADATITRLEGVERAQLQGRGNRFADKYQVVGNTNGTGRREQRRRIAVRAQQFTAQRPSYSDENMGHANRQHGNHWRPDTGELRQHFAPRVLRSQYGIAQSGMGRDAHGLSAGLDGHRWPARPGEPQHDYEPPRTVGKGEVADRAARLKALGNAVVPQCVYPLALAIREFLQGAETLGEDVAA